MRDIDRLECATMGHTPRGALRSGILGSTICWTVMIDGKPEAMMGAAPSNLIDGVGRPWLLMTDAAGRQHVTLVRLGRIYTAAMHRHYSRLENWIHADNNRTIRYLTRLGYAIGP